MRTRIAMRKRRQLPRMRNERTSGYRSLHWWAAPRSNWRGLGRRYEAFLGGRAEKRAISGGALVAFGDSSDG